MLQHLSIKSFAIIDALELDLGPGFTVVTGETGAGKSILVDALSLILGGRASAEVVRTGADSAAVEALFDISAQPLIQARLEQRSLVGDDPGALLIRREVGRQGRGKVVVNGRLATVATLAEVVRGLVEIAGQHEQVTLLDVETHLELVDAFAGVEREVGAYREAFSRYRALASQLRQLHDGHEAALRQADYLRYALEEITRLAPHPDEDNALDAERRRLANAEKLRHGTQLAEALLYGDDGSAFDKIGKSASEVEALARLDPDLTPVLASLQAARRESEDAARALQRYLDRLEADPERLTEVDERLAAIRRVCRKHNCAIDELLARAEAMQEELDGITHGDEEAARLEHERAVVEAELCAAAQALRELRKKACLRFAKAVQHELRDMDLGGAKLIAELAALGDGVEALGPSGGDRLELLWQPNPGEAPQPLAKIASGGELSRLLLAVKAVLTSRDLVALYVFDEVDTGLGGRAAEAIGRKLQRVAGAHQALCVTHLAPIAARADQHLCVMKEQRGGRTVSRFEAIAGQERRDELARMIDGVELSRATRAAAEEMLRRAASDRAA